MYPMQIRGFTVVEFKSELIVTLRQNLYAFSTIKEKIDIYMTTSVYFCRKKFKKAIIAQKYNRKTPT